MPTIQVRTDDQTKTASTALFNQLGITMSEAINLFLRQSIMRGGIPFALTVPEGMQKACAELLENEAIIDALKRYKAVSGKDAFDIAKAEPFFRAVETFNTDKNLKITMQEKAVKVRLNFKSREYTLDYNFEEPDTVFVLSRKDGKLIVKNCNLNGIVKTLERF